MKKTMKIGLLAILLVLLYSAAFSQAATNAKTKKEKSMTAKTMNTYVIEREIPNAGQMTGEDLKGISQKSCSVLKELGPGIEWVHSYVTDNKIFCIYKAENEEILRTHAAKGGFPINAIHLLSTMISPETATASVKK